MDESYTYEIELYETNKGKCPFSEWLKKFKDYTAKAAIRIRLDRARLGNFGTTKFISHGVHEMKLDIGGGIRIYYSMIAKTTMLILCAGTKKTQQQDIELAVTYLKNYKKEV